MGSVAIDVVPYNGALATLDLLTPGQTIILGDFGSTQSGTLEDADGTLGATDDGIATFDSQPITYIGSGTATPGVAVPGPLIIPLGASVDIVAFEAGGQVYFHYPDGPPDPTGAVAVVITIDSTPYPLFTPVCFHAQTMIATPVGCRPAHTLQVGDWVRDIHGEDHEILWTGRRTVDLAACDRRARRRLAPVVVPMGLLGQISSGGDLRVSRHHLILIRHPLCAYFYGADALLIPAAALIGLAGALDLTARSVTYVHLMCDSHVILRANGVATETFLPGPQAMAALTPIQRKTFFGTSRVTSIAESMVAAAPVLSRRDATFLISEIIKPADYRKVS